MSNPKIGIVPATAIAANGGRLDAGAYVAPGCRLRKAAAAREAAAVRALNEAARLKEQAEAEEAAAADTGIVLLGGGEG